MDVSKVITSLRKQNNWSQTELTELTDVSQVMIGKYELGDAVPSIEVAKKIAASFGVSLDYLVGEGVNASFDKKTVKRLQDIEQLDEDTKNILFNLIDTYIQNFKTKQAFS